MLSSAPRAGDACRRATRNLIVPLSELRQRRSSITGSSPRAMLFRYRSIRPVARDTVTSFDCRPSAPEITARSATDYCMGRRGGRAYNVGSGCAYARAPAASSDCRKAADTATNARSRPTQRHRGFLVVCHVPLSRNMMRKPLSSVIRKGSCLRQDALIARSALAD